MNKADLLRFFFLKTQNIMFSHSTSFPIKAKILYDLKIAITWIGQGHKTSTPTSKRIMILYIKIHTKIIKPTIYSTSKGLQNAFSLFLAFLQRMTFEGWFL